MENVFLDADELKKPDFLNDKKAVIYFSSPDYENIDGMGASYAVFVDKNGQATGVRMNGLDNGMMAKDGHRVFLEEEDKVRIIGDHYKEFRFPDEEAQSFGELSGYLKKDNMFFSIYNTGQGKSEDEYYSDVRYGNEKGFHTVGTIPHFIVTSGQIDDHIYIITDNDKNEEDGRKVELREVHINKKGVKVKLITNLKFKDNPSPITIQADEKYVYVIMNLQKDDHNGKTLVIRINKKTHHQDRFTLAKYKGMADVNYIRPLDIKKSTHMLGDELYYVNMLGDVYTFNTKTEKSKKKLSLQGYQSGDRAAFHGKYYYVYKYNEKTHKYSINQYDLKTGELVKQQEIKGMKKIFSMNFFGKSIFSNDFMILD